MSKKLKKTIPVTQEELHNYLAVSIAFLEYSANLSKRYALNGVVPGALTLDYASAKHNASSARQAVQYVDAIKRAAA